MWGQRDGPGQSRNWMDSDTENLGGEILSLGFNVLLARQHNGVAQFRERKEAGY